MTQTEKNIAALKKWLNDNKLGYGEAVTRNGVKIDIYIPKVMVAIHFGDDDEFFQATKKSYAPFFIRESESEAKTIEKITNCCIMQLQNLQKAYYAKRNKRH